MIIDTGSELTATVCADCPECGDHTDPGYNLTASRTMTYLNCTTESPECDFCLENRCYKSQTYVEGSTWEAVMVEDLAWMGGSKQEQHLAVRYPIGCQNKLTGLFPGQKENGIMGVGPNTNFLTSRLVNEGRLGRDVFTLCLGSKGGKMSLGGIDTSIHTSAVHYTPYNKQDGYYGIELVDILINGQSLGLEPEVLNANRGMVIDTGTTDSYWSPEIGQAFKREFLLAFGHGYEDEDEDEQNNNGHFPSSLHDLSIFPTITLQVKGEPGEPDFPLTISPSRYLDRTFNGFAGNIHLNEDSGGVLGARTLSEHDIIFDRQHHRIGFAPARCDDQKKIVQPEPTQEISSPPLEREFVMLSCILTVLGFFAFFYYYYCRGEAKTQYVKLTNDLEEDNTAVDEEKQNQAPSAASSLDDVDL